MGLKTHISLSQYIYIEGTQGPLLWADIYQITKLISQGTSIPQGQAFSYNGVACA